MSQDLNSSADRPDCGVPTRSRRPRTWVSARVAAVAGLSAAMAVGVVAPAAAAPSPAQTSGRYERTVNGVVGTGPQTLEATCTSGDRLASYTYVVPRPTGSTTSRSVSVSSNGRGVRLTYEVVGTVRSNATSLTIVCRRAS